MLHGLLLAGLLVAASPASPRDLPTAVAALEAPTAAERFAAERWLVAHLGAVDESTFLTALEGADLGQEAVWRLGRALGDARGGLGLALELAVGELGVERSPSLELGTLPDEGPLDELVLARRLGDLALDQALGGWLAGLERAPISGEELELFLRDERERSGWVTLSHEPRFLAESVAALNRLGELPAPLVLAPELAERLARERFRPGEAMSGSTIVGPWDLALVELAARAGVGLEAVMARGDDADELAWLRFVPRGAEGKVSGTEQLRLALTDLARGEPLGGEDVPSPAVHLQLAARLLAGVGWQAPLTWLGDRWWDGDDAAALTGLLEAAGSGRFEPRLISPEGLKRLLGEARRLGRAPVAPNGSGPSRQIARLEQAFARMPRSLGGVSTADLLCAAHDQDSELARHLCLVGLNAVGGGGREGGLLALKALEAGVDGETQWVSLGILGQVLDRQQLLVEDVRFGAPEALLALVPDRLTADDLARALARAGARLPIDLAAERPSTLRAAVLALVLQGDLAAAAGVLVEDLELDGPGSWARCLEGDRMGHQVDQLAEGLATLVMAGELLPVRGMLGMASLRADRGAGEAPGGLVRDASEPSALQRLDLLAGTMDLARTGMLLEHLSEAGEGSFLFHDLDALAVLAASPGGRPARGLLVARLDDAFISPRPRDGVEVLPAIESCLALLWARSDDRAAEELIQEVTGVAAGHSGSGHPLVTRVLWRRWPPAPEGARIDLDRLGGR